MISMGASRLKVCSFDFSYLQYPSCSGNSEDPNNRGTNPANTQINRGTQLLLPPNPPRLLRRHLLPDPAANNPRHESRDVQDPYQRAGATRPKRSLADDLARSGADDLFGGERAHGARVPGSVRVGRSRCTRDLEAPSRVRQCY